MHSYTKMCFSSWIGLMDRPLVAGVLKWTRGSSLRGALKTRSCSGLDSWIVLAWSLKNEELFPCGALTTRICSRLNKWILPKWSIQNKELFWIGLDLWCWCY